MAYHPSGSKTIPTARNFGNHQHRETSASDVDDLADLDNADLVSDVRSPPMPSIMWIRRIRNGISNASELVVSDIKVRY